VAALKLEVTAIRADTGRRVRSDKEDARGAREQVTDLQARLVDAATGRDTLRMMAAAAERQRDAARAQEGELRAELAAARAALETAAGERNALQQQVLKGIGAEGLG